MKRGCFTLIELLVVVAIISLLIAILLPTIQKSRLQTEALICGSNVKQLTFGLIMYENDNQTFPYGHHFPLPTAQGSFIGDRSIDIAGQWWFNFIDYYTNEELTGDKTILQCPSKQLTTLKLIDNILWGNYGVNRSICKSSDDLLIYKEEFVGKPLSSHEISRPSQTLLVVDSGRSLISWWNVTDVPPVNLGSFQEDKYYVPGLEINKDKDLQPGQGWDAINGRHPNKTVNVGYVDGQVSKQNARDLFVEKTEDGYSNRCLWVPK